MRELGPVLKYHKTLLFSHSELGNLTKTFLCWCFADQVDITHVCMAQCDSTLAVPVPYLGSFNPFLD